MTIKFANTEKGKKARRIALGMGDVIERYIVEELRLRGYSNHFTSEAYA
jgi:hypothetical protein